MFQSLRSRLWLSYTFVVGVVLFIVFTALAIFAARTNISARVELTLASGRIFQSALNYQGEGISGLREWANEIQQNTDLRVIIFKRNGELLTDSHSEKVFPPPKSIIPPRDKEPQTVSSFKDKQGKVWFYVSRRLASGNIAILALPQQPMRDVLRSPIIKEFYTPLLLAGSVALILSLLFAYLISQWIVNPIQGISKAAQDMTYGKETKVEVKGPVEVKTLAKHFNHMVERLRASQQSQRDLVANVSHELKTPLTSIQGFSQAIMDETAFTPDELKKSASVIFNESSRMHRLVLDLLDLAKLDAGTAVMKRAPVDINQIVEAVIERFKHQANDAEVTIESDLSLIPKILGDGDRLVQVFINLLDNAIKHTPQSGKVWLKTKSTNHQVIVRVIDSGKGIETVQLPRIFERFYQTDKARKGGKGRGVGLGLTIANEIVQAHGGKIEVKSVTGKGSEFSVYLPINPSS